MRRGNHAITVILCLILCLTSILSMSGCNSSIKGYHKNKSLDTSKQVTLRIASSKEAWPEMDNVIAKFEKIYPNCTVLCEYVEEYSSNLALRLAQDERKIDIFRTVNIQETTEYKDYALNLISEDVKSKLDLSHTHPGIVDNFKYTAAENTQYAVPFGCEMRGMYVNKTLLNKCGLRTPTNRDELVHCCEVLLANGYIPLQSNPGTFAQQLLYPYICNCVVNGGNYKEMYQAIENRDPGVSEYFRDAYSFLYEIVEKGYYDYARVEQELGYTFDGNEGKARDFLNIMKVSDDEYEKRDDIGAIAFMPDTQGFGMDLAKTKSDYHSDIEYEFILSPVGNDGGSAYLSPSDGLAISNRSDHIDWAIEFLNFFFVPEISTEFAEETGKIPNTTNALVKYDVPADHISDVGQMTFSYTFYKTVTTLMMGGYEDDMVGISKMNNPKYMKQNEDGTYRIMYSLEDYMNRLEAEFQKTKETP